MTDRPQPNRQSPAHTHPRVRAQLLNVVYADQPLSLLAALVFSAAAAAIALSTLPGRFPLGWLGAMAATLALRYVSARRLYPVGESLDHIRHAERTLAVGAAVSGILWGLISWYAFDASSPSVRAAIVLLIGGIVAAVSRTLACHFPTFCIYALTASLPLMVRMWVEYSPGNALFSGFFVLYVLLMLGLARNFRNTAASSFYLQFENADLAVQMQRDIAAREAAERALVESEQQLRFAQFALDHAQDLVALVDRQGNLLHVSQAMLRYTGRTAEELARLKIWRGIAGSTAQSFGARWDSVKEKGALTFEVELLGPGGERMPVEVNATFVEFNGRAAVCAIARDVSARRAAEQEKLRLQHQLQETQRLESLGVLAGGVAHDFNNLLTAILGNASLARETLDKPDQVAEMLGQVETAANQAAGLCRQMLAYAGRGQLRMESLNLSSIVEESARLLEMTVSHRARLELQLSHNLPNIRADASQIRQIVLNLVHNAAESMQHGSGVIVVRTEATSIDAGMLASARVRTDLTPGPGVALIVKDNGAGMDATTQDRIFEPFFTTKFTGRGLGLPAVLGIVRSHRALLHVESAPGVGSSFRVVFAATAATPAVAPQPEPPFQARPGTRALVVDDEEGVRRVARQVLERIGAAVELAANATEARHLLDRDSARFSLLIVDMTMPGTDGITLLTDLRRRGVVAPAILISGHSDEQVRERLGPEHRCEFLHKPFDYARLRGKVESVLARNGV